MIPFGRIDLSQMQVNIPYMGSCGFWVRNGEDTIDS